MPIATDFTPPEIARQGVCILCGEAATLTHLVGANTGRVLRPWRPEDATVCGPCAERVTR